MLYAETYYQKLIKGKVVRYLDQRVYIIDDDEILGETIGRMLLSIGVQYAYFQSADQFIETFESTSWNTMRGCIICDIRLPGTSGIDCQKRLNSLHSSLPIIFMTGFADVQMAIDVMRSGAFHLIEKPIRHQTLIDIVHDAFLVNDKLVHQQQQKLAFSEKLSTLTPRENDVLDLIVEGNPNKTISTRLDISLRTVEVHRARIFAKLEVKNVVELVRQIVTLNLSE